ncbi:WD repeat-containing protein 93 isoform X1 [Ornithorhynchus anatinus]|uniref:WD repeat domain 93 n=1 Tax=Ornithorhynchus anatinus TaxID=9258 RepID=F6YXH4_ORNAN|nr:WD repeat-containing protein 93 isoform X1 [Ornithorhynchus anatinus]XP_028922009.1 WD repeat-containing protein 93 isoform X1 [Ornithorhynchus anatinus]
MPVYIRKGPLEIPPPSERDWIKDDEEDYILEDPDQILDSLPQPFRMINKLLNRLFDRTWDIIEEREVVREVEQSKVKPTLYQPTAEIKLSKVPNCVTTSRGYLFIGFSRGLQVFSLLSSTRICGWEAARVEITSIWAVALGNETLLATLDDMGVARLFYFYKENLFLIKAINETEDLSKQATCVKLELSPGGEFAAFLLQGGGEVWLDVYRLPKDSWLREMEHPHSAGTSKKKMSQNHLKSMESLGSEGSELSECRSQTRPSSQKRSRSLSPPPQDIRGDLKLSSPVHMLKIRPPKPITGTAFKSLLEALQKMEESSGLGSGQNHLIKDSQWEQQEAIFSILFKKYLDTECSEFKDEKPSLAEFHFLLPGQIFTVPTEPGCPSGMACALGIHWSGSHNFNLYSLVRTQKEKVGHAAPSDPDLKPDTVWPCAAPIVSSAVSSCSSYLALACTDGTVTAWDRTQGFPLAVVALPQGCLSRSLHFLNSSPTYNEVLRLRMPVSPQVQCGVLGTDGALYLVTATRARESCLSVLSESPTKLSETLCAVTSVPALPDAMLIFFWDGSVQLVNVDQKSVAGAFAPPDSHKIASPWQPVFAVDPDNPILLLRGDRHSDTDKATKTRGCESSLFLFHFDSFPLEEFFPKGPRAPQLEMPASQGSIQDLHWDKRCELFLQNRLKGLDKRILKRSQCWTQLRKHSIALTRDSLRKSSAFMERAQEQ